MKGENAAGSFTMLTPASQTVLAYDACMADSMLGQGIVITIS